MTKIKTKFKDKAIIMFCGILTAYLAFSLSFFLILNDKGFYDKTFAKYGAYAEVGVEGTRTTVDYLIKYLTSENSNTTTAGLTIFTQKEQEHLQDVHKLVQILKYATIFSIIALAISLTWIYLKDNFRKKIKAIMKYASIRIIISLIFGLIVSINFDWFFKIFHKILFPQGNYSFPADFLLIILFPADFFQDFFMKIIIYALISAVILYILGGTNWVIENKGKGKK